MGEISLSIDPGEGDPNNAPPAVPAASHNWRKILSLVLKVSFSIAMVYVIFSKVTGRGEDLASHLRNLKPGYLALAVAMQLTAIVFAIFRWRLLLAGQGIRPSPKFLVGSIFIARFFGAFTPGGFTGFGGWRIYDVAKHTGQTARATATIAVETLLGQTAMAFVIIAGTLTFGYRFVGTSGVLIITAVFLAIVAIALSLIAKPALFRALTRLAPRQIRPKLHSLVDAVCAYEGRFALLGKAIAYGVAVHAFNGLIYVFAAQALNVSLSPGEVFFASNLQILSTILPASINGIGLREMTAVGLYTSPAIGLPMSLAVLIPVVGFACEMFVSSFGGLVFALRPKDYEPNIDVDAAVAIGRREEAEVSTEALPKVGRAIQLGFAGGALAGALIGLAEAWLVLAGGKGTVPTSVLAYGTFVYALVCAVFGALLTGGLALVGRWMRREAFPASTALGATTAAIVFAFAFAIGVFRIRRDIFAEELKIASANGIGVVLGTAAAAALVAAVLYFTLARLSARFPRLTSWYALPAVVLLLLGGLASVSAAAPPLPRPDRNASTSVAPGAASNILFIVVDTLRADRLPAYGYSGIQTPNLDAFAADAIRFDQAFANASWTRPSFASLLTGRLPSSHGVMSKPSSLPDEIVTLPESLGSAGYETRGIVTNYNVAPYFNFNQGFDRYDYLEPDFVLGADDAAAKLLLVQTLKRVYETVEAKLGIVRPGSAYQDAAEVNAHLLPWLRESHQKPFFYFVGYMDPHDPYYPHPYDGTGFSRAANQHPDPAQAPVLSRMYDGEIEYWDEHFGELIAALKSANLYDDLTIIVTADHGEEFGEHGGFWHGTTLYDEQVRVPLFVKLPANAQGGSVIRHWVQSIDLMPTLLRRAGLELPAGLQGGDLFEGTDRVFAEESHESNVLSSIRVRSGTDEWKRIDANAGNPRGLAPTEVYRVDLDPGETQELSANEAAQTQSLGSELERAAATARHGRVEAGSVELTGEAAERLRGIGYLSDEEEE